MRRWTRAVRLGVSSLAIAAVLRGQAPQPRFDVASIRPSATARVGGEGSGWERLTVTPTSVTVLNGGLRSLIQWAYSINSRQVLGPDWIDRDRFDVIAKTAQPSTKDEMRAMMQALVAERFRLQLRRETRSLPAYVLVARKNGPNLAEATADAAPAIRVVNGSFVFDHVSMPEFAELLGHLAGIDRLVLDRTGISGAYDVTLPSAAAAMREDPGSIFGALEAIGFELQARKEPVEVLVIERAERPSAN